MVRHRSAVLKARVLTGLRVVALEEDDGEVMIGVIIEIIGDPEYTDANFSSIGFAQVLRGRDLPKKGKMVKVTPVCQWHGMARNCNDQFKLV